MITENSPPLQRWDQIPRVFTSPLKRTADFKPLVIISFQSSVARTLDKSHRNPSAKALGYFLSIRFADAGRMTFAAKPMFDAYFSEHPARLVRKRLCRRTSAVRLGLTEMTSRKPGGCASIRGVASEESNPSPERHSLSALVRRQSRFGFTLLSAATYRTRAPASLVFLRMRSLGSVT